MIKEMSLHFLGNGTPIWYKLVIIAFLVVNPIILLTMGATALGWLIIAEFIFTLAFSLKCYPLLTGGLLALEIIALGLTNPEAVWIEINHNNQVIFLLIFMVAAIHFMRELISMFFTIVFLKVKNKAVLSFLFSASAAVLSAFLDALTVMAVFMTVMTGFYDVYHKYESKNHPDHETLEKFRSFLRSLTMHAAIGTMLGGVTTLVGEPQNLMIGHVVGWHFVDFFIKMSPVTIPVLIIGLLMSIALEIFKIFGYGEHMPDKVRIVLENSIEHTSKSQKFRLYIQAIAAIFLVIALALHIAEVGLIGLAVLIFLTTFNGITDEHTIGKSFTESLPFVALLVVFFIIVSMIHEQHLFQPIIAWVLSFEKETQPLIMFGATGILSAISDNVFVAGIFINEAKGLFNSGVITKDQFEILAIAINTGTNIPSIATPNGQAAFLFLLTSALAPLIRLSYGVMFYMALPYTIILTTVGIFSLYVSI